MGREGGRTSTEQSDHSTQSGEGGGEGGGGGEGWRGSTSTEKSDHSILSWEEGKYKCRSIVRKHCGVYTWIPVLRICPLILSWRLKLPSTGYVVFTLYYSLLNVQVLGLLIDSFKLPTTPTKTGRVGTGKLSP